MLARRAASSEFLRIKRIGAQLDVTIVKFIAVLHHDLGEAAQHGTASPRLWATASAIRTLLGASVAHIEGLNGILKTLARDSPNISLPFLDARAHLRQTIACSGRTADLIGQS